MIVLVIGLEALEDLDGILRARLVHVDLLEAADKGAVLLEILAIFLVGGGADAADRTWAKAGFSRLEASMAPPDVAPAPITVWISSMKSTALGWASISLMTCLRRSSKSLAIAGACQKRAHVEREDSGIAQDFRHFIVNDALGKTLGNGRLATPGSPTKSGLFFWRRQST